ncbi:MAG: PA-phosphatase, partial [Acidimicrobiales bacterium]
MTVASRKAALDRRLHRTMARRSPALTPLILPLSRAAEHPLLWFGLAGALAAGGGRFGRRAALRGLIGAGLASAVANGPVKLVAGRRRPAGLRLAARVPGLAAPVTKSVPSSRVAVAFAFAAGAGQELPALAVPLAALAGSVGYSRV